MEKVFEKIARLAVAIRLVVLVGTVGLIFGGYFLFTSTSSSADPRVEQKNLEKAKELLAQAERTKAEEKQECEQLKKKLKKTRRKMRRFRGMLPDDPQISLLIKDIKSKLSGLTLISYARQPEVHKRIYTEIPLDITVEGPFHHLLKFLHELSIMPRIVNVENISLVKPRMVEGRVYLTVKFRVSTFRYRKRGRRSKKKKKK